MIVAEPGAATRTCLSSTSTAKFRGFENAVSETGIKARHAVKMNRASLNVSVRCCWIWRNRKTFFLHGSTHCHGLQTRADAGEPAEGGGRDSARTSFDIRARPQPRFEKTDERDHRIVEDPAASHRLEGETADQEPAARVRSKHIATHHPSADRLVDPDPGPNARHRSWEIVKPNPNMGLRPDIFVPAAIRCSA